MFFTRIVIAALSLGSVAKVVAAPIAIGVATAPAAVVVEFDVPSGVERRLDLTFSGLIAAGTAALSTAQTEVGKLVENPADTATTELRSVMNLIAPVLNGVSDKVKAAGLDTDSLLAGVNEVKLTPDALGDNLSNMLNVVDKIMATVKGTVSLDALQTPIEEIKAQIAQLDTALDAMPLVKENVAPAITTVQTTLRGLLGDILGDVTNSLGLLAGIAPST